MFCLWAEPIAGAPAQKPIYRLWWDAFDLEVKGERRHWSEDGGFMIAQTSYQGIHRGPFLNYSPTGGPSICHSRSLHRFAMV